MQYLLDFIQKHTLEEQLYFVAQRPSGDLELLWRAREDAHHWQLRPRHCEGPCELIHRDALIHELEARGVDMAGVKQELNAMLAAQIAFADMLLRDANQHLGRDLVQRFVRGHRDFIDELQTAIAQLSVPPRTKMLLVDGGGAQTTLRAGHLSLVRR